MISKRDKAAKRVARQKRVRAKVTGTEARPRLSVFRSLKVGIYIKSIHCIYYIYNSICFICLLKLL